MNLHTVFPKKKKLPLPNPESLGFYIKQKLDLLRLDGPLLILTPDQAQLEHLAQILQFFLSDSKQILCFPDWGTLPYDRYSPSAERIHQRIDTLTKLLNTVRKEYGTQNRGRAPDEKRSVLEVREHHSPSLTTSLGARRPFDENFILLTTAPSLLQRLAPKSYIETHSFQFKNQTPVQLDTLQARLINNGYQRVSQVTLPGEFSIRGAIIDIFPINTSSPFRLESSEDYIESLRFFKPETYQTQEPCHSIELTPSREFPLYEDGLAQFQTQWRQQFGEQSIDSPVYTRLSANSCPPGIEYYLPLFFNETHTLLDYLPAQTVVFEYGSISSKLQQHWELIQSRYEQWRYDTSWPLLPPEQLYQPPETLKKHFSAFKHTTIHFDAAPNELSLDLKNLDFLQTPDPFKALQNFIHLSIHKVLLCAQKPSQREALLTQLKQIAIHPTACKDWQYFLRNPEPVQITVAPLHSGFIDSKAKIAIISTEDLERSSVFPLSETTVTSTTKLPSSNSVEVALAIELKVGDLALHADYGIGQYLGLERLKIGEHETEFITLRYANNAKLYTSVAECHLIHRYSGPSHTPLHSLNTDHWQKTKRKALTQLRDTAAELLELYSERAASIGQACNPPNADYQKFVADWAFEETHDQALAIQQVIQDLCRPVPMDRLVCGDVGFGKTEVAMRAAFLVVHSGKQVAILAPTTLLAEQHYRTFQDRFDGWPIQIDWISRFRTNSEINKILKKWKNGQIDILIGTHALLRNNIAFHNLGLIIIDEEHHFGVQQKEMIRKLRVNTDLLTLTATPIPRTLQMAVSGLRELSIIATPPKGRLPIKNFITPRESELIREAILRELLRGGQVYFVHNHINSLEKTAREIQALVPEALITVAHGQLPEHELETRMAHFYHQRSNILICTSIIETGLDIPTANTLIVDRAHHFGLAQLHQLRGRVGRSKHQAYAYFLVPHEDAMTKEAVQRLEALGSFTELGVGFNIASVDLDIRGAGELLGDQQSGTMQGIGFSLYMELLEQTVDALKSGKETFPTLSSPQKTAELHIPAFIPEDYLPDVGKRLLFYKRIAKTTQGQALQTIRDELQDRYGSLPEAVQYLFQITELKWTLNTLGIQKINMGPKGGKIEFEPHSNIEPLNLIRLIQSNPAQYQLKNARPGETQVLQIKLETASAQERINAVNQILDTLSETHSST